MIPRLEPMYHRMIIRKMKIPNDEIPQDLALAFGKLYSEHGVTVVGDWLDRSKSTTAYKITAYRDEEHYKDFVKKMKTNKIYQEYSAFVKGYTVEITNIELQYTPMMKYNFDEFLMENYLKEVMIKIQEF